VGRKARREKEQDLLLGKAKMEGEDLRQLKFILERTDVRIDSGPNSLRPSKERRPTSGLRCITGA